MEMDSECLLEEISNDCGLIKIQLKEPVTRNWELYTNNKCENRKSFPVIQLFDCEGNIIIETNDDNISIKSSELKSGLKNGLYKCHSVHGDKVFTTCFVKNPKDNDLDLSNSNNTENHLKIALTTRQNSLDSTQSLENGMDTDRNTSSCKSSDNESEKFEPKHSFVTSRAGTLLLSTSKNDISPFRRRRSDRPNTLINSNVEINFDPEFYENHAPASVKDRISLFENQSQDRNPLQKSKSLMNASLFYSQTNNEEPQGQALTRTQSQIIYKKPQNRVSFLETYMRSLPKNRNIETLPEWCQSKENIKSMDSDHSNEVDFRNKESKVKNKTVHPEWRHGQIWEDLDVLDLPSDEAANTIIKRRLRKYRKGISVVDYPSSSPIERQRNRRRSEGDEIDETSSSESLNDADVVLSRLKRRISKNKKRQRNNWKGSQPFRKYQKPNFHEDRCRSLTRSNAITRCSCQSCVEEVNRGREIMGANLSHHTVKGLTGRRARSSGDLCNADTKSQTDISVYGSVVGDAISWNRSLPNHLDSNRLPSDYDDGSNNNYEMANGRYPNKRALRYKPSKSERDLDPVWKLQDPGCDQGYGSERSPEEDYHEKKKQALENYLRQIRQVYPFVTKENTFSVVVEKDGRGLGMSVTGGGESGLVRIRRLYPPQPAWRTGQLAPKDILLAANSMPLAGLSTYEALEVLRTAGSKVELLVCRSEEPCASPPHAPPPAPPRVTSAMDPLNCHPNHNKLSHTGSNATTSSSEEVERQSICYNDPEKHTDDNYEDPDSGDKGKRHRPILKIPNPNDNETQNSPYGRNAVEFDIAMTKVNGSLGFTLRKEDHSALGHYVRALVREPAISDGRIQPGDRIVAVNDVAMFSLSHAEAVAYLRSCGDRVVLRLYRDASADALSPTDEQPDPKTNTNLRQEARCMLNELAARRLAPSPVPAHSPRKSRRPFNKESPNQKVQNTGIDKRAENSLIEAVMEPPPQENGTGTEQYLVRYASFESDNTLSPGKKQKMFLTVAPNSHELRNMDSDTIETQSYKEQHDPNSCNDKNSHYMQASFATEMAREPMSMPLEINDGNNLSHKNPAYQSVVLHSDNVGRDSKREERGLKKWKGVTLPPDLEIKNMNPSQEPTNPTKENVDVNVSKEPTILTVELNRGWNSRLGFSIQCHPESGQSFISAIYNDSVAAKDGRLRQGDIILQVNDENVTSMKSQDVIDLLRILRGSICITVLRPSTQ